VIRSVLAGSALLALVSCSDGGSSDPPTLAASPAGLVATAVGSGRIDLSWTDLSDNENQFVIERSLDGVVFVELARVPLDVTAYTDLGLAAGLTYHYRVSAFTAAGLSAPTPVSSATTPSLVWTAATVAAGPGARSMAAAVYDPVGLRMIVYGGYDGVSFLGDLWSLDLSPATLTGSLWTPLSATGTPPSARVGCAAAYDAANQRVLFFGGQDAGGYRNDLHVLSLAGSPAWSGPSVSGLPPAGRSFATASYDPSRQTLLVYAGEDAGGAYADLLVLAIPTGLSFTWSAPAVSSAPVGRSRHAAVFDPSGDRLLVFGGLDNDPAGDGSVMNGETWAFSPASSAWTPFAPAASPGFRVGHAGVWDSLNRRLVVASGNDTAGLAPYTSSLWAFEPLPTPAWKLLLPAGPLSGRAHAAAIYDAFHRRLVLYGGEDDASLPNDEVWSIGM
jgi:hypothetical protein